MNTSSVDNFVTGLANTSHAVPMNKTVLHILVNATVSPSIPLPATFTSQVTITKFVNVTQSTTITPTQIASQEHANITSNVTRNTTLIGPLLHVNDATTYVITTAYIAVFIFAIFGNVLVIHTVRVKKTLRTAFNWLLVNMALADIMDAIFAIPYSVYSLYFPFDWLSGLFGVILCKFLNYGMSVAIGASVVTMAIISADRFRAVVQTLRSPLSVRAGFRCIAALWIVCSVANALELYRFHTVSLQPGKTVCVVRADEEWLHILASFDYVIKFVVNYALPLAVMSVVYSFIMHTLWKRQPLGESISAAQRKQRLQARQVVKMAVTIVTVFAVCWLPAHTLHLLLAFNQEAAKKIPLWFYHLGFWMAHANSALNPCIVMVFGRQLREASKQSLRRLVARKRMKNNAYLLTSSKLNTDVESIQAV